MRIEDDDILDIAANLNKSQEDWTFWESEKVKWKDSGVFDWH